MILTCIQGKATNGGYGSQASTNKMNHHKERIWFSKYCLDPTSDVGLSRSVRKVALVG